MRTDDDAPTLEIRHLTLRIPEHADAEQTSALARAALTRLTEQLSLAPESPAGAEPVRIGALRARVVVEPGTDDVARALGDRLAEIVERGAAR